jgi:hypothetical protein
VVITTAYTLDMQAVLDAMWAHLLPALALPAPTGASPEPGAAQDELEARLAGLALPAGPGAPEPAEAGPWAKAPFTVSPAANGAAEVLPSLTSVELAPQPGGWQITLAEPGNELTVPIGAGAWAISDRTDRSGATIPVAVSGGWLDGSTLRAEVIFLETPHRMDITCSLPGRTAHAVWRHPPIAYSQLRHLHCPS